LFAFMIEDRFRRGDGVTVLVKSGADGEFRAGNLLPGQYDLAITSSGFQPFMASHST